MNLRLYYLDSGQWRLLDTAAVPVSDVRLTVSYAAAAQLEFTLHAPQHTRPLPQRAQVVLVHDGAGPDGQAFTLARPVFEGFADEVQPAAAHRVRYVCFDATRRAGHELFAVDGVTDVPRLVYNSSPNIPRDDDAQFERRAHAAVRTMVEDIFIDHAAALRAVAAGPPEEVSTIAYEPADLAALTHVPQEKVVFETESFGSAIDRCLQWYPSYRRVFEPGLAARRWRFRDTLASPRVTLTLNGAQAPRVLGLELSRSLERRYGAVEISGPPVAHMAEPSVAAGGLTVGWTAQQQTFFEAAGPEHPQVGYCGRAWQIADPQRRRVARFLTEQRPFRGIAAVGEDLDFGFRSTVHPFLLVRFGGEDGYEPVGDLHFDRVNGLAYAPYPLYRTAEEHPHHRLPEDVVLVYAYLSADESLTVRHPAAGHAGGAHAETGLTATLRVYDDMLSRRWLGDRLQDAGARLAEYRHLAEQLHRTHADVSWTGGAVIQGIDGRWLRLDRRVDFAAVDADGAPLTTGWESIGAVVTDVEYDYAAGLTTLTFSADLREFLEDDLDELLARLKRTAVRGESAPLVTYILPGRDGPAYTL